MCAAQAGLIGKKTLVLERNDKVGAKILISGGGRCNYTNIGSSPANFISENPDFLHGIFKQWTVDDTITFFEQYGIVGHKMQKVSPDTMPIKWLFLPVGFRCKSLGPQTLEYA